MAETIVITCFFRNCWDKLIGFFTKNHKKQKISKTKISI